ncbi:hypothetical protein GCK72_022856 [Caenorhabditis remanei]|uniref:BED-type domain-containing protein n=1 Tax=Caenorhabditis remanei TaxID=31234 RepID=A0A6A5FV13_CAERE|nr:hypothetical protein GCK72_022856 [Caenorhabditis remanei]KAF1746402.1 hypothetical protein GCK72_022856 [Caenorhabditis remanei]
MSSNQSTSSSGARPSFKLRSIVWNFFKFPIDGSKTTITCPACKLDLKYSGSTTGILHHLTARHGDEYKKLLDKKKSGKIALQSREESDIELAKAFATSLTPFRFAENPEFRKFIENKPDDFVLPTAKKVKKIIDDLAEVHMETTKDELEGVNNFTILTDGYSDLRRNYHFYSLHVAYINATFEKKVLVVEWVHRQFDASKAQGYSGDRYLPRRTWNTNYLQQHDTRYL